MKDPLFLYTLASRIVLGAAYFAMGVYIVSLIVARSPDAPVATQPLEVNHRLTAADLQTAATSKLVGRYLQTRVDQGKPVTEDIASQWRAAPNLNPSLAAIVVMTREAVAQKKLTKDSKVRITLQNVPEELSGVLDDIRCDETICSLIVDLTTPPPPTIKPLDFLKAEVSPDGTPQTGP